MAQSFVSSLKVDFDPSKTYLTRVTGDMTPFQMREHYLYQTQQSLEHWEKNHFSVSGNPPFNLSDPGALRFVMTPEFARKISLRSQIESFAQEAKVSTAGVRENQNVICPWDHRYRINEYMIAVIAESLAGMVKELHEERIKLLEVPPLSRIAEALGEENVSLIEGIYRMPLERIVVFARENPVRIVGGEVRANTPRFVDLVSRIYAANDLYVMLMTAEDCSDSSTIFMWSFLVFLLGLSGGDYFTSSHGAPQKQSDKILASDGAQYLPHHYSRLVEKMWLLLDKIEKDGYEFRLAAKQDAHLMRNLDYGNTASLYVNYLKQGPATPDAVQLIQKAASEGLRLKLDFFGGSGYKTLSSILNELDISSVFEQGYIRTEEDPFFHNVGFAVKPKKGRSDELEVVHLSVDASLPQVVKTAGYEELLKDVPPGQIVFNVDPDADRFVGGQVVEESERKALEKLGITYIELGAGRLFALYSPNQLFLMIFHNDMLQAKADGWWDRYANFNIHTYVSAISWDEWAANNAVPVISVPVGFKEIAAVERKVEEGLRESQGKPFEVVNELGFAVTLGAGPKLHHAGEESGGKIGGPRSPIYNVFHEFVIAMREKSSGETCFSAIALVARLYLESSGNEKKKYLHHFLNEIFETEHIFNPMEYRGDIVHYNEAIIDPDELARAKKTGLEQRDLFNGFFHNLAQAYVSGFNTRDGRALSLNTLREILAEAIPVMKDLFEGLEDLCLWSDGIQLWFREELPIRDICLRASGTDAKTKVYFDGKDKDLMRKYFEEGFLSFSGTPTELYKTHITL